MTTKRVNTFVIVVVTVLLAMGAEAADGNFVWAKSMGGTGEDVGRGIAVDGMGNIYTTGYFVGTVDFDPGSDTFNLISAGSCDIFVLKLDSAGDFVWAKGMGGVNEAYGYGITVDNAGNVYTTGQFEGTVDFDPGTGTFNLSSASNYDIFVSKLDSAGDFVWARSMGGTNYDNGKAIAVDGAGNVYTTGRFGNTVDFDSGPDTFNLISAGGFDIFVLKLDGAGDFVWAKCMGGVIEDYGYGIAVDGAANVYTTGRFGGTADFDPGPGTFNLDEAGGDDVFVSKLDSTGDFLWAGRMGGTGLDYGSGIAVDGAGNVYTTGRFGSTVDFDPGTGTFNLSSVGQRDIFVSKLDSAGDFVWAKRMGGVIDDYGYAIAVDGADNVYTTGIFGETVDFDPGAGAFNLTSAGLFDIFVSKMDSAGYFLWAKAMGGTGNEKSRGIAVDDAGNIYTTGRFSNTVDFDPGPGIYNLDEAGADDIFVSKLSGSLLVEVIVPVTASPTNGASVVFNVTFNEAVQNFDAEADLVVTETGTVTHTGVTISGGPMNYTVELTGVAGDGDMTLAVSTVSDVEDIAGLALASSVTSAAIIVDNTPPEISVGPPSVTSTTSGPVEYEVTYTGEDIVTLVPGDIILDVTGDVTATVTILPASTVELSNITGTGTLGFTIVAGTAMDEAGNLATEASTPILVTVGSPMPVVAWPAMLVLFIAGTVVLWQRMGIRHSRSQQGR